MVANTPDRVEKRTFLRAPRSRVWRALTTPAELGARFGARVEGAFRVGVVSSGRVTRGGFDHRWHPYAVEADIDYASETKTLFESRREHAPEGTSLSVVESGFELIPASRRAKALTMNDGGWAMQVENIARHVAS